eukprot:2981448-Lingulodinium_polyedra.AAC.1
MVSAQGTQTYTARCAERARARELRVQFWCLRPRVDAHDKLNLARLHMENIEHQTCYGCNPDVAWRDV